MERRRFIRSTFGFGLIALPGLETFGQNILNDEPGGKMNASASLHAPCNIENIISRGDIQRNTKKY